MRGIADASVVTQLDLIAYHNHAYFGTVQAWDDYRRITHATFDIVDGVAFISHHSLAEARREGLVSDRQQLAVTYCGFDHRSDGGESRPPSLAGLRDGFLLVLGASYLHKNRPYAVRLWQLLRERGFQGQLVLVGPKPPNGNSVDEERALVADASLPEGELLSTGSVSDAERNWLLDHAALVLYPTLSEGFGMVPFEAAMAGTPVLTTRQGALDEVLPPDLLCIESLLPEHGVDIALTLIGDESAQRGQIDALVAAAQRYSWAASTSALFDLIERTLANPSGRRTLDGSMGRTPGHPLVDRAVVTLRRFPRMHRILLRAGSRRQEWARSLANAMRRRRA